ncbi:MAG: N-acetylneuraminate synthase family protein [bacterium]
MSFNYDYQIPKVVAEIGCNHMGDFKIAKDLIVLAKECGADVAKFQTRDNKLLLTDKQYNNPHPVQENSYGKTYGAHREFLEFSQDQHYELKNFCKKIGIQYSTSVWEINSAKMISELEPSFIKVPSACNNNFEMLKVLRDEYKGEVQISFGMTTKAETEEVIKFFEVNNNAKDRLIIYSCTSGYPVPFKDVSLLEINNLYEKYDQRVKGIGFSGHHLGIAIDCAAYSLGARWIERHFTKDRTWRGTDHAASLEPDGLRKLVRNLNACYKALTYKDSEILDIEKGQRDKLKYKK